MDESKQEVVCRPIDVDNESPSQLATGIKWALIVGPIITILISCASLFAWLDSFLAHRIETPVQKLERIRYELQPIKNDLEMMHQRLESHLSRDGHREMLERMALMQSRVADLVEATRNLDTELESFTRDFMRKDELPLLLRQNSARLDKEKPVNN